MPDNYQLNRDVKVDYRTSPTDIGFSLVAIVSAYELKIINEDKAIEKINNIIKNVDLLKKWHGHLYNWYSIKDYKELQPLFISTADSGNFVSSLYVVKGFLDKFAKYTIT
jgi:cyclic beta-1,2-glucan synthetase